MKTIDNDLNSIISNFITKTDRRFDSGLGFYGWRDLKYFLYEYESHLSIKNNIQKIDWQMFSKVEKVENGQYFGKNSADTEGGVFFLENMLKMFRFFSLHSNITKKMGIL